MIEKLIYQWPASVMSRLRIALLRIMGTNIGLNNRFESMVLRNAPRICIGDGNALSSGARLIANVHSCGSGRIEIGCRNYFNVRLFLDACGEICIGNDCMFGPDVYIADSNHGHGNKIRPAQEAMRVSAVHVGDRVWIGAGAKILAGVKIGNDCVIGAGAVVTRSVPEGCVVGGVPARPLISTGQK